jgi:hypothetical protein
MKLHINDYQQSYIEYMPFMWANSNQKVVKMAVDTRKIIMTCGNQSTTNKGVLCTSDVELHILMLTCPR